MAKAIPLKDIQARKEKLDQLIGQINNSKGKGKVYPGEHGKIVYEIGGKKHYLPPEALEKALKELSKKGL